MGYELGREVSEGNQHIVEEKIKEIFTEKDNHELIEY